MGTAAAAQDTDSDADASRARAHYPPGAIVQPLTPNAGADLRRYMTEIAHDPRDLDALLGAGGEALKMGDSQAALGFFSRADEIAPRDARVKAGLGSVMVAAEQPRDALDFFQQAVALGGSEAEIAVDRGLAYDMLGDPARAQQDYRLALRAHDAPEVRRRLALSLAISGQRDAALQAIDAQLRRNDRAAWRAQAFVLALTGDAAGAEDTARRVMPPGTAGQMAPFLARLSTLTASQKAMAVHFGEFPSSGTAMASAAPPRTGPRIASAAPAATGHHPPANEPPTPYSLYQHTPGRTLTDALRARGGAAPAAPPAAAATVAGAEAPQGRPPHRFEPAPADAAPGFMLAPGGGPAAAPQPPARAELSDFAQVAAAVEALPPEVQLSPPPPSTARAAPARVHPAPARAVPRRPPVPANPSRHWVQIATAGQADLAAEFVRLRAHAPDQLGDRAAFTAPMRSSSRLLVGPFDTAAAAQAFVRALGSRISAFAWTSPAGQAVDEVAGSGPARAARAGRARGATGGGTTTRSSRARADSGDDRPTSRSSRAAADRGSTAHSRRSTRAGDDDDDRPTSRRPGSRSRPDARTPSSRRRTGH